MLSHLVTLCLVLLPLSQCIKIDGYMTEEEVLKAFRTKPDNVPDYEVVRLYHTLHKREINDDSPRMVKYKVFGRDFTHYLEPTEGLLADVSTPVWTVVEDPVNRGEVKYTLQTNVLANVGRAYQSVSNSSAIVAYEGEDGETLLQGCLPDNLIVHPLPHRLRNVILRERRDLDTFPDGVDGEADFRRSHHHVIFERHERDTIANDDGVRVAKRRRTIGATVDDGRLTTMPDIVYPEMLIVIDSILWKSVGENLEEAARYVLAFANGVDLRYRLLEEPMIRFNIAGLIISLEPNGTPYFAAAPKYQQGQRGDWNLYMINSHFYRKSHIFPIETYDIVMALSGMKLFAAAENNLLIPIDGVSLERGACSKEDDKAVIKSAAVIYDDGRFYGILSSAHEIAHLMGVLHDGDPKNIDCPASDAYLMSSIAKQDQNNFKWSNCSLRNLYDFLSSPNSTCLRNKPKAVQALPRLLPGQILTLDEQCKKFEGQNWTACYHDARVCTVLACKSPGSQKCQEFYGAAEGSSCGNEMYCINGYCVSKKRKFVFWG